MILLLAFALSASAQDSTSMDLYGFAMLDMGHDFKTIDPDWFDTMRPQAAFFRQGVRREPQYFRRRPTNPFRREDGDPNERW
jgi:hypothetical protein